MGYRWAALSDEEHGERDDDAGSDDATPAERVQHVDADVARNTETLLSSPLERTLVHRAFVWGGPFALLVTITLSLWVSYAHVRYATLVQADGVWVPGSTRAIRVTVSSERGYDPGRTPVSLALEQGGTRVDLPPLESIAVGVAQGTIAVPEALTPGPARLHLTMDVEPDPVVEVLDLELATAGELREPAHTIASSLAQYSDDTEAQPSAVKIDVRAHGRVQTGFVNQFYVRVTDAIGQPWQGPIEVVMRKGELDDHVARAGAPVTVVKGTTDRFGLLAWGGMLISPNLRLRVRVLSRSGLEGQDKEIASRNIMLVSFAGVVTVAADPVVADAGDAVELAVVGLSSKRAVYLDVHDPVGAWIETLAPVGGREAPRTWTMPEAGGAGFVHLEAYDQPTKPGESTATARLQLAHTSDTAISLQPLVEAQKKAMSQERKDVSYDPDRERVWLDHVSAMNLTPEEVRGLRRWLIGTLPVAIYGPPTAMSTRQRDEEAMAEFKQRWTFALRWTLLGGGGLFLVAMTILMARTHAASAAKTHRELLAIDQESDVDLVVDDVTTAQRGALVHGLGLIAVMAAALCLAVLLLETMVWEF